MKVLATILIIIIIVMSLTSLQKQNKEEKITKPHTELVFQMGSLQTCNTNKLYVVDKLVIIVNKCHNHLMLFLLIRFSIVLIESSSRKNYSLFHLEKKWNIFIKEFKMQFFFSSGMKLGLNVVFIKLRRKAIKNARKSFKKSSPT